VGHRLTNEQLGNGEGTAQKVETHPTNTIARADEFAMNVSGEANILENPSTLRTSWNSVYANFGEFVYGEVRSYRSSTSSPRSDEPSRHGNVTLPAGIIGFLCTTVHKAPLSIHKNPHRTGGGQDKSRPFLSQRRLRGARLDNEPIIVSGRNRAHVPNGVSLLGGHFRRCWGGEGRRDGAV
jgi:hypothetical protein